MKKVVILLFALFISCVALYAQDFKLSGRIFDAQSELPLIGASVHIENTSRGSVSNEKGFFILSISKGEYVLVFSYVGYTVEKRTISIPFEGKLDIHLSPSPILAEEVIVTSKNPNNNVQSTETGVVELSMIEVEKLPALMGETDFMRIIQLNPGVQAANDANMGFYVRGGGADQNLVLLDNVTIYNPSHIMGFFSVFNSNSIQSAKLIKSGMPANYGGRLSSIVDVSSRNGSLSEYEFKGNIGLMASNLSAEGPIIKEKLSFNVAARRSYLDEVLKPVVVSLTDINSVFYKKTKYYFADLNVNLFWKPGPKNSVKLSYYTGKDNFALNNEQPAYSNEMRWGNSALAANWNYSIDSRWNLHQTVGYTRYNFELEALQNEINVSLESTVEDISYKGELSLADYSNSILKTGLEYIQHKFQPNNIDASLDEQNLDIGSNRQLNSHEVSPYMNYEFNLLQKLRVNAGIRYTHFIHVGPYYAISKNEIGEISDSTYYYPGTPIKTYNSFEPRISIRYQINGESSIKASFTKNQQNTHMVSSSSVTLPTDVWLPSTSHIKPQKGLQYTLGYFLNLKENSILSSANVYYKEFDNQIELLYGIIHNFQDNLFEESMVFGKGNSYGLELYIHKVSGYLTGWISYTLSKTNRVFDEINQGKAYPPKFDRRHDVNFVLAYNITKKLSLSATFIYATGNALTLPEYKYVLEGNVITGATSKNAFRMPAYHRLDLSLNYLARKTDKFESSWNFSVYNVYNRANPFYIYFEITGNVYEYNLEITPKQITVFPIIPSISWSFKF